MASTRRSFFASIAAIAVPKPEIVALDESAHLFPAQISCGGNFRACNEDGVDLGIGPNAFGLNDPSNIPEFQRLLGV